jgi:hypothetical protein
VAWGGELIVHEHPNECVDAVRSVAADAVIHEAIMTPWWQDVADEVERRTTQQQRICRVVVPAVAADRLGSFRAFRAAPGPSRLRRADGEV